MPPTYKILSAEAEGEPIVISLSRMSPSSSPLPTPVDKPEEDLKTNNK